MRIRHRFLALALSGALIASACSRHPSGQESQGPKDSSAQSSQPNKNAADESQPNASPDRTAEPSAKAGQNPQSKPAPSPAPSTERAAESTPSTERSAAAAMPPETAQPQTSPPSPTTTETITPPPPPKPKPVVIPADTVITVRLGQAVGSKTSHGGDTFDASVSAPVRIGGKTIVPVGAKAAGTVTAATPAGKFKGGAILGLSLTRLEIGGIDYQIKSEPSSQTSTGKGKRTAGMIGGGAGLGAIVGGLAGGGKGAGIGLLVGGAAGTAGAAFTGNRDISFPAETPVNFRLKASLTITPKTTEPEE